MTRSISAIAADRASKFDDIQRQSEALTRDFGRDPSSIDTGAIQRLISDLIRLNNELSTGQETLQSRCLGGRKIRVLGVCWGITTSIAWLLQVSASSADAILGNQPTREAVPIGLMIGGIVVSGIAGVIGCAYGFQSNNDAVIARQAEFENINERNFQRFLNALDEYNISDKRDPGVDNELKTCLHSYEAVHPKYQFLPKSILISQLVLNLDDSHPLKSELRDLQSAVEEDSENSESSEENRFAGEMGTVDSILRPIVSGSGSFTSKWDRFEKNLGIKVQSLTLEGMSFSRDGIIDESRELGDDDDDDSV